MERAGLTPSAPAALAAACLLLTMFLPWYGPQKRGPQERRDRVQTISAFNDVSFVEAAIFLVAAGVLVMLFARAEGRDFHMPGGDGTVVHGRRRLGGAADLLPALTAGRRATAYPVGIEWGFFLAFIAAGVLAYAGPRMRAAARPEAPARRPARPRRPTPRAAGSPAARGPPSPAAVTPAAQQRRRRPAPVPAREHRPFADAQPRAALLRGRAHAPRAPP